MAFRHANIFDGHIARACSAQTRDMPGVEQLGLGRRQKEHTRRCLALNKSAQPDPMAIGRARSPRPAARQDIVVTIWNGLAHRRENAGGDIWGSLKILAAISGGKCAAASVEVQAIIAHHDALALAIASVSSMAINTAGELSIPPKLLGVIARNTPAAAIALAKSDGKRRAASISAARADSSGARA